jgi:hypothetical protein
MQGPDVRVFRRRALRSITPRGHMTKGINAAWGYALYAANPPFCHMRLAVKMSYAHKGLYAANQSTQTGFIG